MANTNYIILAGNELIASVTADLGDDNWRVTYALTGMACELLQRREYTGTADVFAGGNELAIVTWTFRGGALTDTVVSRSSNDGALPAGARIIEREEIG